MIYILCTLISNKETEYDSLAELISDFKNKFSANVQVCFEKDTTSTLYSIITGIYVENNELKAFDKSGETALVTINKIISDTVSK